CCCHATATTALYTLSLHDALPILARHRRRAALRRLLVEGRDPPLRLRRQPGAVGPRPGDRPAHGVLHEPPGLHGLLRRGALARRSEEHTSELQSRENLVCRLLLEK